MAAITILGELVGKNTQMMGEICVQRERIMSGEAGLILKNAPNTVSMVKLYVAKNNESGMQVSRETTARESHPVMSDHTKQEIKNIADPHPWRANAQEPWLM